MHTGTPSLRDLYQAISTARAAFIAALVEARQHRTLDDIARELGMTRQAVHDWLRRAR